MKIDPEKIRILLDALDAKAREIDPYDYGLPVHGEHERELAEIVEKWAETL